MLMHNFEDDNVLFQNTLQLMRRCERAGKVFDLCSIRRNRTAYGAADAQQMLESMLEFFERWLK